MRFPPPAVIGGSSPDQGDDLPGPSLGEAACKNISNKRRLRRWGLRNFDGFWLKKAGKIPGKKLAFSSGLFPGFPRMLCIRVGRQRRPGQKQKTAKVCYPFQCNSGNQAVSTHQIISAGEGAGDHPLPRGLGPRRPRGYTLPYKSQFVMHAQTLKKWARIYLTYHRFFAIIYMKKSSLKNDGETLERSPRL